MAGVLETPELERLFARGRDRARERAHGRERSVEAIAAFAFLAVALGMALLLSSPRSLDLGELALLMAAYVVTCRAKFDIADGYTVPTELVFVPMLFLLPTPIVPARGQRQLGPRQADRLRHAGRPASIAPSTSSATAGTRSARRWC